MMNVMIAYANSAADRWVAWVVAATLDAALLLAVIGLLWFAIRNRVAPQVGYGLFLLVPLKLLMPVVVTVPAAMAPWTPSALMSSWFPSAHVLERIASQPPVEPRMAAVGTETAALRFESGSRSQPVVADSHQGMSPTESRSPEPIEPSASALARSVTEAPRLSVSAMVMIAWLVGVLLLLGRLVATQWRFRAYLQHGLPLDESKLAIDLRSLCRAPEFPRRSGSWSWMASPRPRSGESLGPRSSCRAESPRLSRRTNCDGSCSTSWPIFGAVI